MIVSGALECVRVKTWKHENWHFQSAKLDCTKNNVLKLTLGHNSCMQFLDITFPKIYVCQNSQHSLAKIQQLYPDISMPILQSLYNTSSSKLPALHNTTNLGHGWSVKRYFESNNHQKYIGSIVRIELLEWVVNTNRRT